MPTFELRRHSPEPHTENTRDLIVDSSPPVDRAEHPDVFCFFVLFFASFVEISQGCNTSSTKRNKMHTARGTFQKNPLRCKLPVRQRRVVNPGAL